MKETLCWRCAKAVDGNECCWADGEPVEGWEAEKTVISNNGVLLDSYKVISCPNFKRSEIFEVSPQELADVVGISRGAIFTKLAECRQRYLRKCLREKGYELLIYQDEEKRKYALRRIKE